VIGSSRWAILDLLPDDLGALVIQFFMLLRPRFDPCHAAIEPHELRSNIIEGIHTIA